MGAAAFKSGNRDEILGSIANRRNWGGGIWGQLSERLRASGKYGEKKSGMGGPLPPVAGKVVRKSLLGE